MAVEELRTDFADLFVGPGTLRAAPWESVYRYEDRALFGPCTLEVRVAYQRWGIGVSNPAREPDDHIALELQFLLFLSERAVTEPKAAAERVAFLREHLLRWIRPFAGLMEDGAESVFDQGIAKLLLGYVLAEGTAG